MNTQSFLDELLKTGKYYADKGRKIAEEKLKIPQEGEKREVALDGMKKGALAAGVLALLLGTGAGRRVTGSALKIGSLAAIGGIGWKAYQNWVNQKQADNAEIKEQADNAKNIPINELDEDAANERSQVLLRAMIAAAKADGHIDNKEINTIKEQIEKLKLSEEVAALLMDEINKPLNVKEVAELAKDRAMAAEIYLVSAVVTDKENSMEREYLKTLAKEMNLPEELVAELETIKEEEIS